MEKENNINKNVYYKFLSSLHTKTLKQKKNLYGEKTKTLQKTCHLKVFGPHTYQNAKQCPNKT